MRNTPLSQCHKLIKDIKNLEEYAFMIDAIKASQKFMLGNVSTYPVPKEYISKIRLPYPMTLIEYLAETEENKIKKNITICIEDEEENNVKIMPFQYSDINKKWVGIGLLIEVERDGDDFTILTNEKILKVAKEDVNKAATFFLTVLFEFLTILNCNNVSTKLHHPPAALQKKRIKKKKKPFYSFHILKINNNDASTTSTRKGNTSGTHASPRIHFRRGHIRRLPTGETTWVTSCLVGDKKKGFVNKEYKVENIKC